MATVKIVLRTKKNKDGTCPLALRITKDRKTSFIHLGYHLKSDDWDADKGRVKKTVPNSTRLNNLILKKLAETTDTALELEAQKTDVSSHAVKHRVKPPVANTFFNQAQQYLDDMKATGKYNQYTADKPRINRFKDFAGKDLAFSDVTVTLLERFKVYLRGSFDISERTVVNHLAAIRSVFGKAIREGIVERKNSPFGAEKIQIKFPDSLKVGLGMEDVKRLEDVTLNDPFQNHCRNLWLFSFYFAGMRVSDVLRLRWSDFRNDRLHYSMGKNTKGGSLKTHEKALAIIAQYEAHKSADDLVFPDLKTLPDLDDKFIVQRRIAFTTSRVDKCLRNHIAPAAGISHKLTMHISRHTFAALAADKVPIQVLQALYRHSNIQTTLGYMGSFNTQKGDDALDAIIG
jgi:site-specific recombinase XerD